MVDFFENYLGCTRHPKPIKMRLATVWEKDGSITEYFSCPKCFQTLPATEELKTKLQTLIDTLKKEEEEAKAAIALKQQELAKDAEPATAVTTDLEVQKEQTV